MCSIHNTVSYEMLLFFWLFKPHVGINQSLWTILIPLRNWILEDHPIFPIWYTKILNQNNWKASCFKYRRHVIQFNTMQCDSSNKFTLWTLRSFIVIDFSYRNRKLPIFVINQWRRGLCSICLKSKYEGTVGTYSRYKLS